MDSLNLPTYSFNIKSGDKIKFIFDNIRKKFVVLTPEEWVRQNFTRYLIEEKKYPPSLLSIEYSLKLNKLEKRGDLVIFNRSGKPIMIVEFKAPRIKITQSVFDQIARYNMVLKVNYLVVTNGISHYCCKIDLDEKKCVFLKDIPDYSSIIHD